MNIRQTFKVIADMSARFRREGQPKPEALAKRGILTRDSVGFQEARDPKNPALEHDIDDPAARMHVAREMENAHQDRIAALRERFSRSSAKGRQDFRTANQGRNRDFER